MADRSGPACLLLAVLSPSLPTSPAASLPTPLTTVITLLPPGVDADSALYAGVAASPAGASAAAAAAAPPGGEGPLTNSAEPGEAWWPEKGETGPAGDGQRYTQKQRCKQRFGARIPKCLSDRPPMLLWMNLVGLLVESPNAPAKQWACSSQAQAGHHQTRPLQQQCTQTQLMHLQPALPGMTTQIDNSPTCTSLPTAAPEPAADVAGSLAALLAAAPPGGEGPLTNSAVPGAGSWPGEGATGPANSQWHTHASNTAVSSSGISLRDCS